jgi:hypothetical protein
MTDPPRLRDSDSEEIRSLLRHASPPRSMTAEERRRTERRIAQAGGAAAGLGVLFWIKGLAFGATLGAAVIVGHVVVEDVILQDPEGPPAVASPPRASVRAPVPMLREPVVDAALDVEEEAAPTPTASAGAVEKPDAGSTGDPLAAELALLQRAQASLASNPAAALALTEDHARRYPKGQLGMEREIVAVDALHRLGRHAQADRRARALLGRAKGSLYEERVRDLIKTP